MRERRHPSRRQWQGPEGRPVALAVSPVGVWRPSAGGPPRTLLSGPLEETFQSVRLGLRSGVWKLGEWPYSELGPEGHGVRDPEPHAAGWLATTVRSGEAGEECSGGLLPEGPARSRPSLLAGQAHPAERSEKQSCWTFVELSCEGLSRQPWTFKNVSTVPVSGR